MKPTMLWCLSAALMLAGGCGKHSQPAETPVPNPATAVAPENLPRTASPPPNVTLPATQAGAPATADLPALSRTLRGWIVGHRRLPASFEEFVTSANLTVPPPPPGKKYAIEKSTVILVNR